MGSRLRLVRSDTGRVVIDRWGVESKRLGGVFLHRMQTPDPGLDLHDHPWWFVSFTLWGGYYELRADTREASMRAQTAALYEADGCKAPLEARGDLVHRRPRRWRTMRLDEAHVITHLLRPTVWTLVVHGPTRRRWGFYLPGRWMRWDVYSDTERAKRRGVHVEVTNVDEERGR